MKYAVNWRMPDDEELGNEYDWEYRHVERDLGDLFPTKEHFMAAAKRGQILDIPEDTERTTGGGSVESVRQMTSHYQHPRDVDRIVKGFEQGATLPAPIVVRHPDGHYIMGGNTRQHLAGIHGLPRKALIVDATENLKKGAMRRIAPFNPKKKSPEGADIVQDWVFYGGTGDREDIPQMGENIKLRVLNKLSNSTKTRKNPETGEREFLLHRGMDNTEFDSHKKGEVKSKTSWTPHEIVAANFAQYYEENTGPKSKIVSAWIPEKHIHHAPFMVPKNPGKGLAKDEMEVIVKPHDIRGNVHDHRDIYDYAAKRAKTPRADDSLRYAKKDYGLQGAKKKIAMQLGKSLAHKLEKGAMRRIAPFNPKDVPLDDRLPAEQWIGGFDKETDRSDIPRLEGHSRTRAIHKLHNKTKFRKNPKTGEREFLLYRGMTFRDINEGMGDLSSFTSDIDTAIAFNQDVYHNLVRPGDPYFVINDKRHIQNISSFEPRSKGRSDYVRDNFAKIYHAWVPESAIHHIPMQIGSTSSDVDTEDFGELPHPIKSHRADEHEVIIDTTKVSDIQTLTNPHPNVNTQLQSIHDTIHDGASKLNKGVMRRKYPYNPFWSNISDNEIEGVTTWLQEADPSSRDALPRMEDAPRMRALNKISGMTETRRHPVTGEREFLLHRGMSESEFDSHKKGEVKSKTSWTPDIDKAYSFARDNIVGDIASAWVPEKHIHHVPFMFSGDANVSPFRGENEIIVNHQGVNIHKNTTTDEYEDMRVKQDLPPSLSLKQIHAWKGREGAQEFIKQRLKGTLGKSLASKLEMQNTNNEDLNKGFKSAVAGLAAAGAMTLGGTQAKAEMKPHTGFTKQYVDHALDNGMGDHLSSLHSANLLPIVHFDDKTGGASLAIHDMSSKKVVGHFDMNGSAQFPTQKIAPEKWNAIKGSFSSIGTHFKDYLNSFGKTNNSLEKGLKGDWTQEGYQIEHRFGEDYRHLPYGTRDTHIMARDAKGTAVGSLSIESHRDGEHHIDMSYVHEDHQRKGLASAMYAHAEKIIGSKLKPSSFQSPDAEKLWDQPNRPFGKKKELKKATAMKLQVIPNDPLAKQPEFVPDNNIVAYSHHMPEGWQDHHPDLIHGLKSDSHSRRVQIGSGITSGVRVATNPTQKNKKVVVKPPMSEENLKWFTRGSKDEHLLDREFTSAHREASYHRVASDVFGIGKHIPETTLFKHPNTGIVHSAQAFVRGCEPISSLFGDLRTRADVQNWLDKNIGRHEYEKIHFTNAILGNGDRHGANALINKRTKTLHLIDHGFTFDYGHSAHNHDPYYSRHNEELNDYYELHPDTHKWLQSISPEKMADTLNKCGVPVNLARVALLRLEEAQRSSIISQDGMGSGRGGNQLNQLMNMSRTIKQHRLGGKK